MCVCVLRERERERERERDGGQVGRKQVTWTEKNRICCPISREVCNGEEEKSKKKNLLAQMFVQIRVPRCSSLPDLQSKCFLALPSPLLTHPSHPAISPTNRPVSLFFFYSILHPLFLSFRHKLPFQTNFAFILYSLGCILLNLLFTGQGSLHCPAKRVFFCALDKMYYYCWLVCFRAYQSSGVI